MCGAWTSGHLPRISKFFWLVSWIAFMENSNCIKSPTVTKQSSPLSMLRSLCPTSHSIDVDHYFEMLKLQCAGYDRSKVVRFRRTGSSDDELMREYNYRKKKRSSSNPPLLRRRTSASATLCPLEKSMPTTHHQKYDHQVDNETEKRAVYDKKYQEDFILGRQKSWDLHLSKKKGSCEECLERVSNLAPTLTNSLVNKDICTVTNVNKKSSPSFPCNCNKEQLLDELYLRHLESAIAHGKINSVSEQNRKQRRKYFDKERSKSNPEVDDMCEPFKQRLSLDEF